jgi:hypothetical protein
MATKKTKEELKSALESSKEELTVAKGELKTFEKTNGLEKGGDHSKNEKFGKKWQKIKDTVTKKEKTVEGIRAELAELKAEKAPRTVKYEYPKDVVSAEDKKKYRTKMRAAAKKAEKGETTKASKGEKAPKEEKGKSEEKGSNKKKKKESKED